MTLAVENIPNTATVTNNTATEIRIAGIVKIPASASGFVVNLTALEAKENQVRGNSQKERVWQGLVEMHRTSTARGTGVITITATSPNVLPLTTTAYIENGRERVNVKESYATRLGFPDFVADQGPISTAISAVAAANAYVDLTFNEGVFRAAGGLGVAAVASDFTLTHTGVAPATLAIASVTKTTGAALTGGETVIRVNFTPSGTLTGASATLSWRAGVFRDAARNLNPAGSRSATLL
jgi:hypothetical protein